MSATPTFASIVDDIETLQLALCRSKQHPSHERYLAAYDLLNEASEAMRRAALICDTKE